MRLLERRAASGERILVRPILHLDAHRPPIADLTEDGEEPAPGDVAEPRQLRDVILQRRREDPDPDLDIEPASGGGA